MSHNTHILVGEEQKKMIRSTQNNYKAANSVLEIKKDLYREYSINYPEEYTKDLNMIATY